MAVVMVHAYPSEDLENSQAVEQVESDPSEAGDLEGAESRYGGGGYGRGNGWNRGYNGWGKKS